MRIRFAITAELSDDSNLEALQDRLEAVLVEHGATVESRGAFRMGRPYRVIGTHRGKPDKAFDVEVIADDEVEAKAKAMAEDDTRAIAAVLSTGGEQIPIEEETSQ